MSRLLLVIILFPCLQLQFYVRFVLHTKNRVKVCGTDRGNGCHKAMTYCHKQNSTTCWHFCMISHHSILASTKPCIVLRIASPVNTATLCHDTTEEESSAPKVAVVQLTQNLMTKLCTSDKHQTSQRHAATWPKYLLTWIQFQTQLCIKQTAINSTRGIKITFSSCIIVCCRRWLSFCITASRSLSRATSVCRFWCRPITAHAYMAVCNSRSGQTPESL